MAFTNSLIPLCQGLGPRQSKRPAGFQASCGRDDGEVGLRAGFELVKIKSFYHEGHEVAQRKCFP